MTYDIAVHSLNWNIAPINWKSQEDGKKRELNYYVIAEMEEYFKGVVVTRYIKSH